VLLVCFSKNFLLWTISPGCSGRGAT